MTPDQYMYLAAAAVIVVLIAVVLFALRGRKTAPAAKVEEKSAAPVLTPAEQTSLATHPLTAALSRTRNHWWGGLSQLVARRSSDLGTTEWDQLEETLLQADVSLATSQKLLGAVKTKGAETGALELGPALKSEIETLLTSVENGWNLPDQPRPFVISIVGVNGVGKTTTAGKLAYRFSQSGQKVLLGACDSFRAAAIEQLRIWSERAGCQFVSGREGADPGATAFDAVSAGVSRGMDLVLLDTAGRLHTKTHLMDELKRVHKVIKKVLPEAPHQIWLVVDGTLGQNSLVQAKQFHETLGLTGVIVTKLDGTAKGGAVLSLAGDLGLPVRFIGVGEQVGDLVPFEGKAFSEALLA
jgi:fused signal recognition particle receptor